MSNIIVRPYIGQKFETKEEVIKAWNQNVTFATPDEFYSCMNKRNWIEYGNKLDTIVFIYFDLHVTLFEGML